MAAEASVVDQGPQSSRWQAIDDETSGSFQRLIAGDVQRHQVEPAAFLSELIEVAPARAVHHQTAGEDVEAQIVQVTRQLVAETRVATCHQDGPSFRIHLPRNDVDDYGNRCRYEINEYQIQAKSP